MIHPNIQDFFPDNKGTLQMFSEICNHSSKKNKELSEFIKWHQDTNKQVIKEIEESQKIDFEDKTIGTKWAEKFLSEYDEKIRKYWMEKAESGALDGKRNKELWTAIFWANVNDI